MWAKYKYYIIVAIILVVVIVLYKRYRSKQMEALNMQPGSTPGQPGTATPPKPAANDLMPLQKGSVGNNVAYLQRALNNLNAAYPLTIDGKFGENTYNKLLITMGTAYYPVTSEKWTEIINKSIK